MPGAARCRPPPFRLHVPQGEHAAARLGHDGLRRCRAQTKYFGPKLNPLLAYKTETAFQSRLRLPKVLVSEIAEDFGRSPFFGKKTDPDVEGRDNFCNAEFVVSIYMFFVFILICCARSLNRVMLRFCKLLRSLNYFSDVPWPALPGYWSAAGRAAGRPRTHSKVDSLPEHQKLH